MMKLIRRLSLPGHSQSWVLWYNECILTQHSSLVIWACVSTWGWSAGFSLRPGGRTPGL